MRVLGQAGDVAQHVVVAAQGQPGPQPGLGRGQVLLLQRQPGLHAELVRHVGEGGPAPQLQRRRVRRERVGGPGRVHG